MNRNDAARTTKDLPTRKPDGPTHKADALSNQAAGTQLRADAEAHRVAGTPHAAGGQQPIAAKHDGSPGGATAPKRPAK